MEIAVAEGRCSACGHALSTWTPTAITAAIQAWDEEHGQPPRAHEWGRSAPSHPANTTVHDVFGSWNAGIAAAGFDPRTTGAPVKRTREEVLDAMLDFLLAEGRWPTYRDWTGRNRRGFPSAASVRLLFGSWAAAIEAAGRTASLSGRRWVSDEPTNGVLIARSCAGCGTSLDNRTIGCETCANRFRPRSRKAVAA